MSPFIALPRSLHHRLRAAFSLLGMLLCTSAFAGEINYWLPTPKGWEDRNDSLGRDLLKQVVAPGGVAAIEVYGASGDNPGLQVIANTMEQGMRARGAAYLNQRLNDQRRTTTDGYDAIFREYAGDHHGTQLRAYALYTYGNGSALAAFGFYAVNQGAGHRDVVRSSIEGLRFSPPSLLPLGMSSMPAPSSTPAAAHPAPGAPATGPLAKSPNCAVAVGSWQVQGKDRVIVVNDDGTLGRNPDHTWSCSSDGKNFVFRWVDGARVSVWSNIKMEAGGNRMTFWQAGVPWERLTRIDPAAPAQTAAAQDMLTRFPKCSAIIGSWKSTTKSRVVEVTPDGHLNHNTDHKWNCHPDGKHYSFHWNVGKPRSSAWDDIRMDPSGQQITWWQAGVAWERFVKMH